MHWIPFLALFILMSKEKLVLLFECDYQIQLILREINGKKTIIILISKFGKDKTRWKHHYSQ